MQQLWTPWRMAYVSGEDREGRNGVPQELAGWPPEQETGCVFCNMIAATRWAIGTGMSKESAERATLILEQGANAFICLNRYPYSTGHVMIVPYLHVASLVQLPETTAAELMSTARRLEAAIRSSYNPDGLNLGLNLGQAAGAGVAQHLHMHELPRWSGDTNFMTVTAETRILPEALASTWSRLRSALANVQL